MLKRKPPTRGPVPQSRGFTLVELLVVIGIIALLVALLLPSLSMARRSAQRTACQAKLHSIMIAAMMHRNDHADYYPLAGVLPGATPETLDDTYCKKYDYFSATDGSFNARQLCPITTALETEMAGSKSLYAANSGIMAVSGEAGRENLMLDPRRLTAYFLCPSHASSPLEILPQFVMMYAWPTGYMMEPQSYMFNEYVLGYQDNLGHLAGKGSLIRKPELTIFAADGSGGSTSANHGGYGLPAPMYTVYNMTTQYPVSLADALAGRSGYAGDPQNFDKIRHSGKINIAFCDGHVEAKNITAADLGTVWISAP